MTFCWLYPRKTTSLDTKIGAPISPKFPWTCLCNRVVLWGSLSTVVLHFSPPSGRVWFSCLKACGISSPSLEFTDFTGMFQDLFSLLKCSRNALRSLGQQMELPLPSESDFWICYCLICSISTSQAPLAVCWTPIARLLPLLWSFKILFISFFFCFFILCGYSLHTEECGVWVLTSDKRDTYFLFDLWHQALSLRAQVTLWILTFHFKKLVRIRWCTYTA